MGWRIIKPHLKKGWEPEPLRITRPGAVEAEAVQVERREATGPELVAVLTSAFGGGG